MTPPFLKTQAANIERRLKRIENVVSQAAMFNRAQNFRGKSQGKIGKRAGVYPLTFTVGQSSSTRVSAPDFAIGAVIGNPIFSSSSPTNPLSSGSFNGALNIGSLNPPGVTTTSQYDFSGNFILPFSTTGPGPVASVTRSFVFSEIPDDRMVYLRIITANGLVSGAQITLDVPIIWLW